MWPGGRCGLRSLSIPLAMLYRRSDMSMTVGLIPLSSQVALGLSAHDGPLLPGRGD